MSEIVLNDALVVVRDRISGPETRAVAMLVETVEESEIMTTTVAGVYKDGKIELLTVPAGVQEGPVLVTLQELPARKREPRFLPYGLYKQGRASAEEDFKIAEWSGEDEADAR